jgi:hypothetical protein
MEPFTDYHTRMLSSLHFANANSTITPFNYTVLAEAHIRSSKSAEMAPKEPVLHSQDLADGMHELDRCKDPRAAFAFDLMQDGRLYPLNNENLRHLGKSKTIFGDDAKSFPLLSGREDSPFAAVPTALEIQTTLSQDIGGKNTFHFAPSHGSPSLDAQVTMSLLQNIANPTYNERGAVIHMISPTLERLRRNTTSWQHDGLLGKAAFQTTIAPASEVFDIAYYEYHRVSALLTGSRAVITYPPSSANLSLLLLEQYSDIHDEQTGDIFGTTFAYFSHGIAIVQKAGETLTLPPFWSFVTFYTSTSVAAEYCVATATKYIQRLEHMDLYLATTRMWPGTSKQQAELIKYISSLATHLDMILNDNIVRFDAAPIIRKLCWTWDPNSKPKIAALIGTIDNEEERQRLRTMFHAAWIPFIDRKRKKKIECRLCRLRFEGLGRSTEDMRWLELHVVSAHGLGSEGAVARGPVVGVV